MISSPSLLFATLLSMPLAAAWVIQPLTSSASLPALVANKQAPAADTRRFAFQVPPVIRNFRAPDYEPYDWENDRLEYVDEESERPWKIDDEILLRDNERHDKSRMIQKASTRSRWNNPFTKFTFPKEPELPIYSRASLSTTDAGTLIIDLPASGIDSSAISSGVFGALWFSAVVPITFAGGIATAAFMLPFWLAGGFVAKNALIDPFTSSQLTIGEYAWSLTSNYGNKGIRKVEGSTHDLRGATVQDLNVQVNGKSFYGIKLCGEKGGTGFGSGLELEELEYLAFAINKYLQNVKRDETPRGDDGIYGFISGQGES